MFIIIDINITLNIHNIIKDQLFELNIQVKQGVGKVKKKKRLKENCYLFAVLFGDLFVDFPLSCLINFCLCL